VKRWQHTRGSNSMRAGGRGEAKSRRSHGDVVRIGHGFTGQLTLGRSPDCLVAGRRADLSEGVGKQQVAVLVDGHSVGLPFRLNRRSRALAIDRAACPSSALWAPSPRGGRIRWLSIRWGGPNVGSYASVYAIGHRPPLPREPRCPTSKTTSRVRVMALWQTGGFAWFRVPRTPFEKCLDGAEGARRRFNR
jgi:hypothetical protein